LVDDLPPCHPSLQITHACSHCRNPTLR
jgi:hypothetical protein